MTADLRRRLESPLDVLPAIGDSETVLTRRSSPLALLRRPCEDPAHAEGA
jgi:hypothetical protein